MAPKTPTTPKGRGKGRGRGQISIVKVTPRAKTPLISSSAAETKASADEANVSTTAESEKQGIKLKGFSRAAHSIMTMHKQQRPTENVTQPPTERKDPWAAVMDTVAGKASRDVGLGLAPSSGAGATSEKRISLAQMLKSREMKNLVEQALVAKQVSRVTGAPEEQSRVMSHWIKLSTLRRKQNEADDEGGDGGNRPNSSNNEEEEESETWEDANGVHSGFDLDDTAKGHQLYGRTLILEESCRRALAQDGEQRSQMDLQSLGVWFQTTKLKITTDFERLQPSELDLLCKRMTCVSFHPDEIIFRQGDEGDALYIVFSGTVEVRVSQRILGEVVEVTVCELGKGDYFGERSLLNNDVRAATVLSKTATDLVRITRNDYNLMLKNDQLEFLSRMQIANGIGVQRPVQRTQREYIKVLTKKKHARSKADIDMLSEYLQTLKFFRSLPKAFVRELCTVVDFQTLLAGACVFREGEIGDLFYIIFSGSVDVNINSKDFKGNMQMTKLVNLTEGSHFGELALMKGRGVRSATVVTREECQLLVICEKDYNATLRRMQKKDMAKRVGVLDQIPMFQTPEWTGELLKELSYVLLEQKVSTGSVLYRQGDRATHVYFVVRGEVVVTKEITDPFTQVKHEVFVERIGRFHVFGDDAAAGTNFNEVLHREVTVSATTPVEILLLSKYDVFHRLSRSARETLRAAAQSHAESIVYLDRFHKTQKWEAYKQKILREHVNHERIEKILPSAVATRRKNTNAAKTSQPRQATATRSESRINSSSPKKPGSGRELQSPVESVTLPALPLPPSSGDGKALDSSRSSGVSSARQALVPANELLLLAQEAKAMKKCLNPDRTLGNYVTSFNVDAPPSSARQRQLDGVLVAENRRQAEVLKEGNPLAFFDIKVVEKQIGASWNRTTKSLNGVEECDTNGPSGGLVPETQCTSSVSPLRQTSPSRSLKITPQALSQLLQENFIFSRPAGRKPEGSDGRNTRLPQHKGSSLKDALRKLSFSPTKAHSPSRLNVDRIQTDNSGETDYVLFGIMNETSDDSPEAIKKSPAFQILQSARSLFAAREAVERLQEDDSAASTKYYVLPFKTFALMPRADRSKIDEERLQVQQFGEIGASGRTKVPASPSIEDSTSSLQSMTGDPAVHFASFQEAVGSSVLSMTERRPGNTVDSPNQPPFSPPRVTNQSSFATPRKKTSNQAAANSNSIRNTFAVASVVLSKLEVAHSQYEEPFVAVHALFSSEMEAVTHAMSLKPAQLLKSAMLCVFPMGKWLRFDHAHDWCVQVEVNKREKRAPSFSGVAAAPTSPTSFSPNAPSRRLTLVPEPPQQPTWQQERDEAKRLHNFICARMGAPVPDKKKDRTEESGGFTPQPLVSLENKLDTLHNYLQATAAFTSRTGHGGVALLKYRQVKRFGSIMRSRIAGTLPHSNNNSGGNNNSSLSPRTSFSTVVPG
ncbi:cGMP-dependent protein kinase [Phytophthora ramorum]|uniref:cGMP-dependent protein kinase n=1 Tax=Phytophthora ramorum TaxID=164328 RepID=UPI0030AA0B28|nr:cGMP-dependent protein kinase [Phytophthora ramorum]